MSKYLFTDLHMHSKFSDEDLCDESPKHILSKVQGYAEKYIDRTGEDLSCVISITDHNSILGSFYANEELKTGKYPNVKFVPGVEFTVDLCEMNSAYASENVYTRCHILGYNYNLNDRELLAYSKIAHMAFSKEDNIGLQICASRRAVCEHFGIYIPFSTFVPLTKLNQNQNFKKEFIKIINKYFTENNLEFDREEIDTIISPYIEYAPAYKIIEDGKKECTNAVKYISDSTAFGRIKLTEVVKLIKDAGGDIVIAHPSMLKISLAGCREILSYEGQTGGLMQDGNNKHSASEHISLLSFKSEVAKALLNDFILKFERICGYKLDGIETFYANNFINRVDIVSATIAKDNGLFETGGSDYHGENFVNHKTIGNHFPYFVQLAYGKENNRSQERQLYIRISSMPAVSKFIESRAITNDNVVEFMDENGEPISWNEINLFVAKTLNNDYRDNLVRTSGNLIGNHKHVSKHKQEALEAISYLAEIAELYNPILDTNITSDERLEKLFLLEAYTRNSYKAIKKLQNQFRNSADLFDVEEQKTIITLLKEIHRKYNEMTRLDPLVMKEAKRILKLKFNIKETFSDKVASITFKTPEKQKSK